MDGEAAAAAAGDPAQDITVTTSELWALGPLLTWAEEAGPGTVPRRFYTRSYRTPTSACDVGASAVLPAHGSGKRRSERRRGLPRARSQRGTESESECRSATSHRVMLLLLGARPGLGTCPARSDPSAATEQEPLVMESRLQPQPHGNQPGGSSETRSRAAVRSCASASR